MDRKILVVLIVSLATGFILTRSSANADHLPGCTTNSFSTPDGTATKHTGSDQRNHCNGGDGLDRVVGLAAADQLGGGPGKDEVHGGSGSDDLTDTSGNSDFDLVCDGDGSDSLNIQDGDSKDEAWFVQNDGQIDYLTKDLNPNDEIWYYDTAKCPGFLGWPD
jgi:Ca2+-binding RTX toxin-like protein